MYIFVLAATALILAAVLCCAQASGTAKDKPSPPQETDAGQRLRRLLAEDSRTVEALAEAVQALETVMAHPELGGPGFLMIQFPSQLSDNGRGTVTAQYPNIREELYRRIVRQELDWDGLAAAGIPETLLSLEPSFETESGGVVLISVQIKCIPSEFAESLHIRRERNIALGVLAEALETKLPRLSIRTFGTDLLLSPDRERDEVPLS